jgi:hypothetical protein
MGSERKGWLHGTVDRTEATESTYGCERYAKTVAKKGFFGYPGWYLGVSRATSEAE